MLCTHKGCPVSFKKSHNMLLCACHWSSFDPAKGGRMVIGQASEPLPQIALQLNNGLVRAVGIAGLIYGRHTNIR
jgi:arsenite oxidase small subunit